MSSQSDDDFVSSAIYPPTVSHIIINIDARCKAQVKGMVHAPYLHNTFIKPKYFTFEHLSLQVSQRKEKIAAVSNDFLV